MNAKQYLVFNQKWAECGGWVMLEGNEINMLGKVIEEHFIALHRPCKSQSVEKQEIIHFTLVTAKSNGTLRMATEDECRVAEVKYVPQPQDIEKDAQFLREIFWRTCDGEDAQTLISDWHRELTGKHLTKAELEGYRAEYVSEFGGE